MIQMPSLLQPTRNSTLEQNYEVWKENYLGGLAKNRLYQVARNWTGAGSTIDFELLSQLIFKMDAVLEPGGILVFLPSYEAIVTLKEHLSTSSMTQGLNRRWWVFVLHFQMLVADLKQTFLQPPPGIRKIVLTTDIAENIVTIGDIAYVIDTGLIM
uniref:Helicase C-terminal domain-containing protein n=1 Tax=Mesocestoides corti TaxID=53468 RepID=A0A5K3FLK7_MESCO